MDDQESMSLSLQEWGAWLHNGALPYGQRSSGAWPKRWAARRATCAPFDLFTLFTALGEHADYERMMSAVRAELGEQVFAAPGPRGGR